MSMCRMRENHSSRASENAQCCSAAQCRDMGRGGAGRPFCGRRVGAYINHVWHNNYFLDQDPK